MKKKTSDGLLQHVSRNGENAKRELLGLPPKNDRRNRRGRREKRRGLGGEPGVIQWGLFKMLLQLLGPEQQRL